MKMSESAEPASHPSKIKSWIEAMRLRTLPVSVAGVIAAWGLASLYGASRLLPALLCLAFAVLAQIASNFANEYYDYRDGLDRPGREGPRRGVTEGDITPRAMLVATFATLGVACCIGLSLIAFGGWWLLIVGAVTALGALAYSAGPYPLSRHALGEVAVVVFFGIVPVNLTFYLQTGYFTATVAASSVAIGLMTANVLIVNNYRDVADDRAVGKTTLAILLGPTLSRGLYAANALAAVALMWIVWAAISPWTLAVPAVYLAASGGICMAMKRRTGAALTPLLGMTAVLILLYSVMLALLA